jgi:hypothetical protein
LENCGEQHSETISNDSAAVIERAREYKIQPRDASDRALVKVLEITGGSIDHVPPMYEFEISCSKRADDHARTFYLECPICHRYSTQLAKI